MQVLPFANGAKDALTADGNLLVAADNPNDEIVNRATGRSVTDETLFVKDGETVAWLAANQSRLYYFEVG
jgi:hypothetical protein